MATSSGVYVGSAVLEDLQSKIMKLSGSLKDVYETMVEQMKRLNEFWQDSKYEEFKQGFSGQIAQCMDISGYYASWSKDTLGKVIASVQEVERTDVSGGTIGSVGAASAGAMAGASAAGAAAGKTIGSGFNVDGNKTPTQDNNDVPHYNRWQRNAHISPIGGRTISGLSDADYACQKSYGGIGGTMHAVPVEIVKNHEGSGFTTHIKDPGNEFKVGAKATAGGKISAGPASFGVEAGPEAFYTVKGIETEAEIGCMSEKKMEELNKKEGIKFNM